MKLATKLFIVLLIFNFAMVSVSANTEQNRRQVETTTREQVETRAKNVRATTTADLEERKEHIRTREQQSRCEQVAARSAKLQQRYGNNKQVLLQRFENAFTKVEVTLEKATEAGIDVADIQTSLDNAKAEVEQAKQNIDAGLALLEDASELICVGSDTELHRDTIMAANEYFAAARENLRNAKDIFVSEIIPSIKQIINELNNV